MKCRNTTQLCSTLKLLLSLKGRNKPSLESRFHSFILVHDTCMINLSSDHAATSFTPTEKWFDWMEFQQAAKESWWTTKHDMADWTRDFDRWWSTKKDKDGKPVPLSYNSPYVRSRRGILKIFQMVRNVLLITCTNACKTKGECHRTKYASLSIWVNVSFLNSFTVV